MNTIFRPCIIIPCYKHAVLLEASIPHFLQLQIPIIIVNDGCTTDERTILEKIAHNNTNCTLLHHAFNQGKGEAMKTGFRKAIELGFSHAIQIDADGQHNITDIPQFLELAIQHPNDLISGSPIYDESIPKSRLYSRYITHFWVWIETLSLSIKDSMCGFRVYPLTAVDKLYKKQTIGQYMDFDTEIMVRLYWQGTNSRFIPTKVTYPENGISNFRMVNDNLRISWMHTKLVFGMILRFPKLLWRKLNG